MGAGHVALSSPDCGAPPPLEGRCHALVGWAMTLAADFRLSTPMQMEHAVHSRLRMAAITCYELQGIEQSVRQGPQSGVHLDP